VPNNVCDLFYKLLHMHGLFEGMGSAQIPGGVKTLDTKASNGYDLDFTEITLEFPNHFQAIFGGHSEIGDNKVDRSLTI
jgi:hypothetical protein